METTYAGMKFDDEFSIHTHEQGSVQGQNEYKRENQLYSK